MDEREAQAVAQMVREAEWKAYDRVLHWINTQETKLIPKGSLYDAVIEMRPSYFAPSGE